MPKPTVTADEKRWQSECDAHTLSDAKVIMGDSKRLVAATKAAERMAKEKEAQAKAMRSVANKTPKGGKKK